MIITLTIADPNGSDSNLMFPSSSRYSTIGYGEGISSEGNYGFVEFYRFVDGVRDDTKPYQLRGYGSGFNFSPSGHPPDVSGTFNGFELRPNYLDAAIMHMTFSGDAAWPGGVPLSGLFPLTADALVARVLDRSPVTLVLNGNVGPDRLHGSFWNDELHGGPGADIMDGRDGNDTLSYTFSQAGVTINLATGAASGGDALSDKFYSIENVVGSDFRDKLTGDANANFFDGGLGYDVIRGGDGNDFIFGRDGGGLLYGDAGNDRIDGGIDADTIYGGIGNDELRVGTGTNTAYGEDGDDFLLGDSGNDRLLGGAGVDRIYAGNGANTLNGGTGIDELYGGIGNDTYYVDNVGDIIFDDGGTDTVLASASFTLPTFYQIEVLRASSATATTALNFIGNEYGQSILGNAGINRLTGNAGADRLYGYDGADTLLGGADRDVLYGGIGNDISVFNTALNAATNVDTIADFANVSGNNDILHLENAIFTRLTTTGALSSSFFSANAAGQAQDADDYVLYETDTGRLFYDRDGSSAASAPVLFAVISARPALTAVDFSVI